MEEELLEEIQINDNNSFLFGDLPYPFYQKSHALASVFTEEEPQEVYTEAIPEINTNTLLFVNDRIAIINSIGSMELTGITIVNIADYRSLWNQLIFNIKKEEIVIDKKESGKMSLQKEMLAILKSKILLFYYDYRIRVCDQWNHYPYFKEQIKSYDNIWGAKDSEPIIIGGMQIKAQGLKSIGLYGYDKDFFKKNDRLYNQFIIEQK